MTAALFLLGYACVLATAGGAVLRRAGWTRRAPRLAILAWCSVVLSVTGSVLMAGVRVTTSASGAAARPCHAPVDWTCSTAVTTAGTVMAVSAAAATFAVSARVLWCLTRAYAEAGRRRRAQLEALAVLGHEDERPRVTVIGHAAPAAYCLPGRHGRVVVTTAALEALDDRCLEAVLAHEHAHLTQHHHLLRTTASALAGAFPHVPAFVAARDEIALLAELAADDAAARSSDRLAVAEALLTLAEAAPAAAPALTAGGSTSAARAHRLIRGERPLGRSRVVLALVAAAIVLAAPAVALAASSSAHRTTVCCTTAQHGTG